MSTAAIRILGVSKVFPGSSEPAVDDLTLDIPEGRIVALVGPSGSGKTTTLRMINRLIEPTSGTIEVLGRPNDAIPAPELRRQLGYVIQRIGLFPHRTIEANIGTVPRLLGWDKARIAERARELVTLVGLEHEMLTRYPDELSGGQQQRVGVARALAADPPILLMDEPYSAVDPIVRGRLQDELLDLQATLHKTIVIVTHDIDEAIKLGDAVALFATGGRLEQYGAPDELLERPASEFVESFLGSERSLRRLGLQRVGDTGLDPGPVVDPTTSADEARSVMAAHGTDWVGVREDGRVERWVGAASLNGATVGDSEAHEFASTIGPDTALREALDGIVRARTQVAVVNGDGGYLGMVTLDLLRERLD